MNLAGVIRLALSRILANKTRSALTILGIVIGVGALVGLVSIVQSATNGISSSLQSLGGNSITVSPTSGGTLTDGDVAALSGLEGVSAVSATASGRATATYAGASATLTVNGVSPTYTATTEVTLQAGTFLPEAHGLTGTKTIVLSSAAADDLGIDGSAIGTQLVLDGRSFSIVGILADSTGFPGFGSGTVYVPLDTARTMFTPAESVDTIKITADTASDVNGIVTSSSELLLRRHHISDPKNADFTVTNQAALLSSLGSITGILQLLLGGIASISLLVGGIGIMNIMLVSVRERTREIGIRRAIGAKQRNILTQFLIESVVLSVIGGILGLLLGVAIAAVVSAIGGLAFGIQGWVVALAIGFSALVGIVFGVGPARAAARMQPVDALRYE